MFKRSSFIKKRGGLFAVSLIAGLLLAGCGGGGGGGGGSSTGTALPGTALGDFIANSSGGSMNFTGSWNISAGTYSATINVTTLTKTGTATYTRSNNDYSLNGTTWSSTPVTVYDLASSGGDWIQRPVGATLVDLGTGTTATITPTGEAPYTATFAKNDLTGPISANSNCFACGSLLGNYPANAALYTETLNVDWFSMYATPTQEVTGETGTNLTSAPNVGDTFCDPYQGAVFQPNNAPSGDNYDVLTTPDCSSVNITAAINFPGTSFLGTVTVSDKVTNRNTVQNVLLVTSTSNSSDFNSTYNNTIYALKGSSVWYGTMIPAGNTYKTLENSTAINSELSAGGFAAYP
ncbi:MAG: hypothetical protein WBM09_04940 [Gallionella sp.]